MVHIIALALSLAVHIAVLGALHVAQTQEVARMAARQ